MILRIKKTLVGAGGIKLIQHPGLVFPSTALKANPMKHRKFRLQEHAPPWGISTQEVMLLLHCSSSRVRQKLHEHQVHYVHVKRRSSPPSLYWNREEVEQIVRNELPITINTPKGCVNSETACQLLGLARSGLHRYAKKGTLKTRIFRSRSRCGLRTRCFYVKKDVEALAKHLQALRKGI